MYVLRGEERTTQGTFEEGGVKMSEKGKQGLEWLEGRGRGRCCLKRECGGTGMGDGEHPFQLHDFDKVRRDWIERMDWAEPRHYGLTCAWFNPLGATFGARSARHRQRGQRSLLCLSFSHLRKRHHRLCINPRESIMP